MFNESDNIILNKNIPEYKLKKDDPGTIVYVYEKGKAYEIKFTTFEGKTLAVITLELSSIRKINKLEIPHARSLNAFK
jgi:hypothetical protein